jgi:transcriptional regulator with XRE-family HTH domain
VATQAEKREKKRALARRLGFAIARLRSQANLKQDELAWRADIHRAYMGHIERGEKNITVAMLVQIAEALRLPPSRILQELEQP